MVKARKQKPTKARPAPSRGRRLKVFRTPIGFHDAYVAAPSRKAALEAWGAGTDLFGAGIAEEAKADAGEATAMKAALAKPGEIVRVARAGQKEGKEAGSRVEPEMRKSKTPKPSRTALDKAEAAISRLEEAQAKERAELAREEEKLAQRRRTLDDKQAKAGDRAEAQREAAEDAYRQAMADWAD